MDTSTSSTGSRPVRRGRGDRHDQQSKQGMFSVEERMEMLREAPRTCPISGWSLVRPARGFRSEQGISAIVKGLRDAGDLGYELQMPDEQAPVRSGHLFIATNPAFSLLSSSLVRRSRPSVAMSPTCSRPYTSACWTVSRPPRITTRTRIRPGSKNSGTGADSCGLIPKD